MTSLSSHALWETTVIHKKYICTFTKNWGLRNLLLAVRIGAAFKTDPFETGIAVFVGKVEEMQKN